MYNTGTGNDAPRMSIRPRNEAAGTSATRLPLYTSTEILELTQVDAVINLQRWWKHHRRHNHKRIAELSEQLRRYAESLIQKKRQARIRAKIRDIVLHLIFLYTYTVSCHHGYSHERLFRLVSATTSEYQQREFTVTGESNTKTYSSIASPADLYAWLRGPFISLSYTTTATASKASTASLLLTNRVVGGIRIGQLRVQQLNCTARVSTYYPTAMVDDANTTDSHDLYCYGSEQGAFSTDDESTDPINGLFPFSGLNNTDTASERSATFSSMTSSNTQTLPAPAFSVVLPRTNATTATQILDWLETNAFVDLHTRAVMIDLNLFNVMLRYVVALRFLIEFPPSGGAIPSLHVSTAPLTKSFLVSTEDVWWTVCNLTALCFYLYFLLSEVALQANRRRRRLTIASGKALRWSSRNGSMLRLLSLALYFTVWLLRLFTLLKLPAQFPLVSSSSEYIRLRPFAEAFRVSQYLLGANTCLCWWILLLLLRVLTHVDLFIRTIEHASSRLITLLLCLVVLLYGYASAFLIVVGAESPRFRSIPQAMATLLLLLFGSANVETTTSYSTMEMLLFACFLLLNVFIISNLFLVVIFDAYRRASDDAERLQNANDQFNLPLETWYYCSAVLGQLADQLRAAYQRFAPARLTANKDKRLSVVRVISSSKVIAKSKQILAGQVDALTDLGDKLARNVAAGLGGGDRDLLIEADLSESTTQLGSGARRRRAGRGTDGSEPSTKLLQGMLIQLAIQNDNLQRAMEEMRREMKHSGDLMSGDDNTRVSSSTGLNNGRPTSRTSFNSQLRTHTFALNRPKHDEDEDDDEDGDIGDDEGDDIAHVVDSPAELTAIQSI